MTLPRNSWIVLFAVVSLFACSKKSTNENTASSGNSSAQGAASSPPSQRTSASTVLTELRAIVDNCRINAEHGIVSRCENREKRKTIRRLQTHPQERAAAFAELVETLGNDDQALVTAASRVLEGAYRSGFGEATSSVSKPVTLDLLQRIPKLGKRHAAQVIPAAAHAAMITGQQETLYQTLDRLPSAALQAAGYSQLMTHGGLGVLPKLRELTERKEPVVAAAALQAALSGLDRFREAERPVCELGLGKIAHPSPAVSMRAAQILLRCKESDVEHLIAELEKREKEVRLSSAMMRGVYGLCGTERKTQTSSEQCQRVRQLFQRIAREPKHDKEVRAAALFQLGAQFPDRESAAFCKEFLQDSSARLQAAANEALRQIERRGPVRRVQLSSAGSTSPPNAAASQSTPRAQ